MDEKRESKNNAANKIQKTLSQMSTHSRNVEDGSTEKPKATTNYRSVSRAESKGGDITPILASSE